MRERLVYAMLLPALKTVILLDWDQWVLTLTFLKRCRIYLRGTGRLSGLGLVAVLCSSMHCLDIPMYVARKET